MAALARGQLERVSSLMSSVEAEMDLKLAEVDRLERLQQSLRERAAKAPSMVKLNLRGRVFQTYSSTLTGIEGTFFHCMLASDDWQPGEDGAYFIDRPYEAFERILAYLSDGTISYRDLSDYDKSILSENLKYFQINIDMIEVQEDN